MPTANEQKLQVLEGKREIFFQRLQTVYDNSRRDLHDHEILEEFLCSIETLDEIRNDFQLCVQEINAITLKINEDAKPEFKTWLAFEDLYCRIKRKYTLFADKPRSDDKSQNATCKPKHGVKLAPIEISEFNGNQKDWPLFYATFHNAVHLNESLSDTERMYYLLGKLTGNAKSICAGIVPCAENYSAIYKALIEKYDDKRNIANLYINQLFSLKSIASATANNLESFIDQFSNAYLALNNLNLPNLCDFILLYTALQRLDKETARLYEMENRNADIPTLDSLITFVRNRVKVLARTGDTVSSGFNSLPARPKTSSNTAAKNNVRSFIVNNNDRANCVLCDNLDHDHLYSCPRFQSLSPRERYKSIKDLNGCINCLSTKHTAHLCKSLTTCKQCKHKHHTMLHFASETKKDPSYQPASNPRMLTSRLPDDQHQTALNSRRAAGDKTSASPDSITSQNRDNVVSFCSMTASSASPCKTQKVLLGTAQADVKCNDGSVAQVRILIDNGSQNHFITRQTCKRLGIRVFNNCSEKSVMGIGNSSQTICGITDLTLFSRYDCNFCLHIQPLVIKTISSDLPSYIVDTASVTYLCDIPLADPQFNVPGPIDILLGSEVFIEILRAGKILGSPGQPDVLETAFGHVVMGSITSLPCHTDNAPSNNCNRAFFSSADESIEALVSKFWQLESIPTKTHMSKADQECERFYVSNTHRDNESGRYVTALPFAQPASLLGDSLTIASRRFTCLERRFKTNNILKTEYDIVMRDYLKNNIISPAPALADKDYYVIPHHGVCRPEKPVRIVLNASEKTNTNTSLNDCLHSGPNLQADLTAIILKFRLFPVALTADIKQMFLHIEIRPEDRRFLNILYRFDEDETVKLYQFNRVCFGLRCSPYLAMRTVRQLAQDETDLTCASKIASEDMYMDDLGSSVRTSEEGVQLASDLIELFKRGGFDLVKFISNSSEVLQSIPPDNRLTTKVEFDKEDHLKLLGLVWSPAEDEFSIALKFNPQSKCTKRLMLSTIAKLWDINGFCAPVILYAKLLIKALWLAKIDWDDQPPHDICVAWSRFLSELPSLENFKIPRFLGIVPNCRVILLGFADASEKAMGAAIYICIQTASQTNQVNLIGAKSKVAPLKVVSLARLELCALLLLSKLFRFVIETVSSRCHIDDIYAFTDSTVALHWVHSSPHRFDTFVANRISQIQDHLDPKHFYHVETALNPSDCLSRGLSPAQLMNHPLWLHGPSWARDEITSWPINRFTFDSTEQDTLLEIKRNTNVFISTDESPRPYLCTLAEKVSSWSKLLRIAVYLYRFLGKLPRSDRMELSHIQFAETTIVKALQGHYFKEDINAISNNRKVSKSLIPLSPFLDNNLIRVGGRLDKSSLDFDCKHPILLPKKDPIVDLIIDYYHRKYLHAGPQLLLSLLRQKFWIISGRSTVKRRFRLCNSCFKVHPRTEAPFMAALPAPRVNEAKPFLFSGVDYAGPINILISRYRGARKEKAYICLFTCFVTRAVHLELAVDLSTESFLRAFRRFISRRGNCSSLYSDNGTNFIGAKAQLNELNGFLKSKSFRDSFAEETLTQGITWHLNPPSAPHFGGSWETMVNLVKNHLRRVIGEVLLTYEELLTVLTQVEAVLNSRPLTVLSSDPAEPIALTPAHFLTLGPVNSFHSNSHTTPVSVDLIRNKQFIDQIVQRYWNRWKREYLNTMQVRARWNTKSNPVTKGTVVLIKTENSPPLQWPLGIIENIHTASDGVVRVVTVRTKTGLYVRPVVKLCVLPSQ